MSDVTSNLPALLLARAAAQGQRTILRKKERGIWQAITWALLAQQVQALGLALRAVGIGPGVAAGILADTRPAWLAADLAIQGAGGMSLALLSSDDSEGVGAMLRTASCRVVFVENDEQLDKVLHVREECPAVERIVVMDMKGLRDFADPMCESLEAFSARGTADAAEWAAMVAAIDPASVAILAPTSGSAGPPRLAALTHANLTATLAGMAELTGQGAADERLAFLPPSVIGERVPGLYLALYCGSVCNFVENAETVPENLREIRPSTMLALPRVWERLRATAEAAAGGATWVQRISYRAALKAGGGWLADGLVLRRVRRAMGLDRLRIALVGGAPVSAALIAWYRSLGVDLREVYGVAECGGIAAVAPPGGTVCVPVPWGELRLDAGGEVLLRGPHVAATGWQDGRPVPLPDSDGWLHTGDLGHMEGGGLVLAGRRGDALGAAAFESAVKLSPFIADAMLLGDADRGFACLVVLEHEAVENWAHERNIVAASATTLADAEPVVGLIAGELRARGQGVALVGFRILARRLEPGDEEMTQTMRLRRHVVLGKYRDLIDDIYRHA